MSAERIEPTKGLLSGVEWPVLGLVETTGPSVGFEAARAHANWAQQQVKSHFSNYIELRVDYHADDADWVYAHLPAISPGAVVSKSV
ncbi:hypothetical protein H7097_03900 [Aeromicrobium sp.]|nr:hypothetical protein [Candidatus Saccharibacteria bacterium]